MSSRKINITINYCNQCPYLDINENEIVCNETGKPLNRYDNYEIPDWCELEKNKD